MRRIISKIDYDMQMLLKVNPSVAYEMFQKIKDRKFILEYSAEIITAKDNKSTFFAPTICYMILRNEQDIDKEFYRNLVIKILKNSNLNRIVINNVSFLDLIKNYIINSNDEYFINLLKNELNDYTREENLRYISYNKVMSNNENGMIFKDNELDINISLQEVEVFSNLSHINYASEDKHQENVVNFPKNTNDNKLLYKRAFERNTAAKLARRK